MHERRNAINLVLLLFQQRQVYLDEYFNNLVFQQAPL